MAEIIENFLKPGNVMVLVVICLLIIGRFIFKIRYASVSMIINNYISCFKKKDGKIMIVPIVYYFGIPFIIALIAASSRKMDDEIVNVVTIIVSILTTMLFALMTILIEMKAKVNKKPQYYNMDINILKRILMQTYYIVMFEILLSIIILILCLFNAFVKDYSYVQSFLIYYLVFLLLINLFMVLKRICGIIDQEMEND